ncbi:MAG: hypothetical protein D3908_04200, partial [Candidatus Electrothrix sp. AUS4]|nr:hypothetical protein [Candidatus Electrothrix sp. AUS4]
RQGTWIISKEELEQLIREDENIAWLEKFELGGRALLNRNSDRLFRGTASEAIPPGSGKKDSALHHIKIPHIIL